MMINILDIKPQDYKDFIKTSSSYRIKQIIDWIFVKKEFDFMQMSNLPLFFRQELAQNFKIKLPEISKILSSKDDSQKFLLKLKDNNHIEMVLIPSENKYTLCVSSQVGCKMNCKFCATAKMGFSRNLTLSEIISQILLAQKFLQKNQDRLTNIVFMGMGEPLDNYENIIASISVLREVLNFSKRKITLSTCGIVPKILELNKLDFDLKLAVSLNSAIEEKRTMLMPINQTYNLKTLKNALFNFKNKPNFRITFEYILFKDFNMSKKDILALKEFCNGLKCKLNLIAYNNIDDGFFKTPSEKEVNDFLEFSRQVLPFAVMLRNSKGLDISASCGQLAIKEK